MTECPPIGCDTPSPFAAVGLRPDEIARIGETAAIGFALFLFVLLIIAALLLTVAMWYLTRD